MTDVLEMGHLMWRTKRAAAQNPGGGPQPGVLRRAHLALGQIPTCCDQPMQPRLAEAHDRIGHSLFVTLWRCAECGRSVY
jgi:hypothetical protein